MSDGKTIVLGVTGGIAAYKACDLVSRLVKKGYKVHVIMTKSAEHFVNPLTFRTLSGHPVITDMFSEPRMECATCVFGRKRTSWLLLPRQRIFWERFPMA